MLHLNKKIKITIFAIAMTVAFCQTNAQQQLATLNHNDTIRAFYGTNALQQAHDSAVGGDIITLSSGSFTIGEITKAITIRGAGMFYDTAARTNPTIVNGVSGIVALKIAQDSINHLCLDGLYITDMVQFNTTFYNPQFIKCNIASIQCSTSYSQYDTYYYGYMFNPVFINCIIGYWLNYVPSSSSGLQCYSSNFTASNHAPGAIFSNSIILSIYSSTIETFNNCIIGGIPYSLWIKYKNINNCIILDASDMCQNYYFDRNAENTFNSICIRVPQNNNDTSKLFIGGENHNLRQYKSYASVFKTFRGVQSLNPNGNGQYVIENETFELQDSIANTFLGSDSTQIGIYGGAVPYSPSIRRPRVGRSNVALRSTADGKLSVDIEVVSE